VDPFVAEIRIVPFNFPPKGWAFCDGQLMPISQNTALFSLVGTFYGGDGKSTFALPNFQGMSSMHAGSGSGTGGLSQRFIGEEGGEQFVTLLDSEMPAHTHTLEALNFASSTATPGATTVLSKSVNGNAYSDNSGGLVAMSPQALTLAGGSQPHNNMMPYLVLNYIIALQGVFPPRS